MRCSKTRYKMILPEKIFPRFNSKLAFGLIIIIIALAYSNSLTNSFIWDDYLVIVNNDFIKSFKNFPAVFSKNYLTPFIKAGCCYFPDYAAGSGESSYRPVVTLSYFIDYFIWKLNPSGYHVSNLLLHILNAAVLFVFIGFITKNKKLALLSSLIFSLHPVNSEAVNVISFREELLAFLFYLSSFSLYVKANDCIGRKKNYRYLCSITLFFLALFSKEMAVTLPFMLVLYDWTFFPAGKNSSREVIPPDKSQKRFNYFKLRYAGYVAVLLFYLIVRFFLIVNTEEPAAAYQGGSFYTNFLTMTDVFATYMKWFLFPVNIHIVLPEVRALAVFSLFAPRVLVSMVLVVIYITWAMKIRQIAKEISFAMFWIVITLLPVSNILPLPNFMAARYLYIPAVGFAFLFSALLFKLVKLKNNSIPAGFSRALAGCLIILVLTGYFVITIVKNAVWKNNMSLWSEVVKDYPDNALVHHNLGEGFKEYGMVESAVDEYKKAITLNPQLVIAYNKLGELLGNMQRYEEAVSYFKQSIEVDRGYPLSYNNLGVTYARMQKWEEAKQSWQKSLEIDPANKEARENLRKLKKLGY